MLEPQQTTNETSLSADAESFDPDATLPDPDATLPYVLDAREEVYRVGWTGKVEVETMSDEEDAKDVEIGELWTHVYHADRPPAPYAESWKDEGWRTEGESLGEITNYEHDDGTKPKGKSTSGIREPLVILERVVIPEPLVITEEPLILSPLKTSHRKASFAIAASGRLWFERDPFQYERVRNLNINVDGSSGKNRLLQRVRNLRAAVRKARKRKTTTPWSKKIFRLHVFPGEFSTNLGEEFVFDEAPPSETPEPPIIIDEPLIVPPLPNSKAAAFAIAGSGRLWFESDPFQYERIRNLNININGPVSYRLKVLRNRIKKTRQIKTGYWFKKTFHLHILPGEFEKSPGDEFDFDTFKMSVPAKQHMQHTTSRDLAENNVENCL